MCAEFRMLLLLLLHFLACNNAKQYCKYSDSCWPRDAEWEKLACSLNGKVHRIKSSDYMQCFRQGTSSENITSAANGICMQYHDCAREFCKKDNPWNLPGYSVEVLDETDVQKTITFANKHNMAITVKTSGHSYSGSSTAKDSLLIWMHKFKAYFNGVDDVIKNFADSCGTTYPDTIRVGGGQVWGDVYRALGSDYNIVGGYCLSVSAAGGWLQGMGLSLMSRRYGLGIDNVLGYDVVLPSGIHARADACTNTDLFWALRGGGGGTWGVVTSVHYKVHPAENALQLTMVIQNPTSTPVAVDSWIRKWVELSPHLDRRWGGNWLTTGLRLFFVGTEKDARSTFITHLEQWRECLPKHEKENVIIQISKGKSYWDLRRTQNEIGTGIGNTNVASRLIPRDFVVNNPKKVVEILKRTLADVTFAPHYFLGGAVSDVDIEETAVHPAMRKAVWQINTFTDEISAFVRTEVKNSGTGINHSSPVEPDWRNALWGKNLKRLQCLKKQLDPENRFNCWHCVGYQGKEYSTTS